MSGTIDTQKPRPRGRNVRKLLARMNPKGMGFQPGGFGGIPTETPLDIAGALGLAGLNGAPQRLAVLTLCLRWWPGMFEGPMTVVGHRRVHVKPHLHQSLNAKGKAVDPKRQLFLVGCCEDWAIEQPSETPSFHQLLGLVQTCIQRRVRRDLEIRDDNIHAQLRAEFAGQRPPPDRRTFARPIPEPLASRVLDTQRRAFVERWARAVIFEYRNPNHCQACQVYGRVGEVPRAVNDEHGRLERFEWTSCTVCYGQGVVAWSSHRRAQALGIGIHPFRDYLKPHHEGALSLLRTLEERGASLILKRIGDRD